MKNLRKTGEYKLPVLALAPGGRHCGVAVLDEKELLYFAVKTMKTSYSSPDYEREIALMLNNLFNQFTPKNIVYKKLNPQQRNFPALQTFRETVETEAVKHNIPVTETSFKHAAALLVSDGKRTKAHVFAKLTEIFPELRQFTNRPSHTQKRYYERLLAAVAIGLVAVSEGTEKKIAGY